MRVKLISCTPNMLDVIYTGARTCYNAGSPLEMYEDIENISEDKKLKLVKSCIESLHHSVLEHAYFTFAIEGISRSCSHQLVRHRLASYSQQSQRYVEIKENQGELYDLLHGVTTNEKIAKMKEIVEKYFVDINDNNYYGYIHCLWQYTNRIECGETVEDARNSLPNATKTNIVMSLNLRSCINFFSLRLCNSSQLEIRKLASLMRDEILNIEPWLKPYLVPKCILLKGCNEHKSCGYYEAYKKIGDPNVPNKM